MMKIHEDKILQDVVDDDNGGMGKRGFQFHLDGDPNCLEDLDDEEEKDEED